MKSVATALGPFVVLGVLASGAAMAQSVPYPECKCQNYGRYIKAGETACIRTNKGPQMARCIKRGNVTDWDFLGEDCSFTSMTTVPKSQLEKMAARISTQ
ncbi:MAG: hypothetical protein AAGF59_03325 [Pseudomonadota bacterium]